MAGISKINVGNYLTLMVDAVEVTSIISITGGGSTANIIDVLMYNEGYAKKLVGSKSVDAFEVTCSYVPSEASYKALAVLAESNETVEVKLTLKGGTATAEGSNVLTFSGIVASKSVTTEFDANRTAVWTIAVSGGISEADGV
ncbi:hypothetical protein [Aeromonas sp. AE23HZ002T15]